MSLDNLKTAVMALVLIALMVAALALGLDAFQTDASDWACESDDWYNSTSRVCCQNSTGCGGDDQGGTAAFNSTDEGLQGTANASSYLSTIGTLIGVGALIAVVIAAFYMIRR